MLFLSHLYFRRLAWTNFVKQNSHPRKAEVAVKMSFIVF